MQVLKKGAYVGRIYSSVQAEGIIAGTTVYLDESSNGEMHSHESPHISFVINGGSIDKRQRTSKEQHSGSIAFYYAGEAHQTIQKIFPARHVNLELDEQFLNRYQLTEEMMSNCIKCTPDAKFFMIRLYHEFMLNDSHSKPSIQIILLELLNASFLKEKYCPSWVKQLEQILRASWNESIELPLLSQLLGVHPVTISKNFSRYFGCTFGEYMRKLKIEHAISIIKCSHQSLTEVAYTCGFADQSHLIRTFKYYTGFLPLHFKKA